MISKKKVYSVALASALTFTAIAPLAPSMVNAASITEGTVTSHSLTVRTGPSANYAATDWIRKGDKVTVLKDHGAFSYVQYGNKKGYVSDSYLKKVTKTTSNLTEGTVTASSLTVRSGASVKYAAIDWLRKGDKVTILKDHGAFSYVQYGNKKGYVSDSYLKKVTKSTSSSNLTEGTVTASSLTVRSGASASHAAIDWLKKGAKVSVLKDHGSYVYVQYGNKKGYVHEDYLKLSKATATTPSVPVLYERIVSVKANDPLNMRKGASVSHSVITKLHNGSKVDVYKVTGDWAYVGYKNLKGYVHTAFLKTTTSGTTTPTATATHKVKAGDTLWSISQNYKTTVKNIKDLNGLKNDNIRVGQTLKVNGTNSPSKPAQQAGVLKGKEIVIDPGHGGRFAGAHGYVVEEDVNLQISLKLRNELQALGATVIMTRTTDVACTPAGVSYSADLTCRPGVAKKNKSDMFISIHSNAGVAGAKGAEVYWYSSSRDAKLARLIQSEIVNDIGMKDRGSKYGNFSVIRNSGPNIPSVLVETGFVTNPNDAAIIGNSSKQTLMAKALSDAVVKYYGK